MPTLGTPIIVGLTDDEKAAAQGTAGTPSNANRYVTDQDGRLHNLSTSDPTTIQPDDAAAAGVGTLGAREDHQHAIVAAAPAQGIGGSNAEGVATSFARSDHDHVLRETGGPTDLPIGAVPDGYHLARVGASVAGVNPYDPARTIVLAKEALGADATTVADAITAANALTPTAAAPVVILAHPGVYSTAPFTLPAYVHLVGVGGPEAVFVDASTLTAALCSSAGLNSIKRLTLRGANGVGGIAVAVTGTGGVTLEEAVLTDCETGLSCEGAGYAATLKHVDADNCVDAYRFDGVGARGRLDTVSAALCTNGLRIGSTGGIVTGQGYRAADDASFTRHVWVEAASAVLAIVNSNFREDKAFYDSSAEIAVAHASVVPGDEAYQFTAELHVGDENRPRESAFGGGDSHTRGMAALTNTNLEAGTWADITAQLKDEDATSVALFPGTAIGNTFYIGADQQFPGLKTKTTVALAIGTGALVLEYWNGATWVSMPHMSADADAPYGQYAQAIFQRINSEQIRFGTQEITGWATKSLNGITKYWARLRISAAITTPPQADRIKVHTNRTEINKDGVVEYFGAAEVVRQLNWHRGNMWELVGFAQPNSDIPIATNFSIKGSGNRWQDGNKDGAAATLQVQEGLDTSRRFIYEVGWTPEATGAGNVELQLDVVTLKPGDILGALPYTRQLSQIITGPFTANQLYVTQFAFTAPDLPQNGSLAIALYRDAGGGNLDDTFGGDARHVWSRMLGTFWR